MTKKKYLYVFAVLFITVLSVTNLYMSNRNHVIKCDTTLKTIDVSATDSEMHGRPLLYNSTLDYKCQNFSGTDCGARMSMKLRKGCLKKTTLNNLPPLQYIVEGVRL